MPVESPVDALWLEQAAVQGVEQGVEQAVVQVAVQVAVQVLSVVQAGQ